MAKIGVVGDSISLGYRPQLQYSLGFYGHTVERALPVDQLPTMVEIDTNFATWVDGGKNYDAITINAGLHDFPSPSPKGSASYVSIAAYEVAWRSILTKLVALGTDTVFCVLSTPVDQDAWWTNNVGLVFINNNDCEAYNSVLISVFNEAQYTIPNKIIIDLYNYSLEYVVPSGWNDDKLHFNFEGCSKQGTFIAEAIKERYGNTTQKVAISDFKYGCAPCLQSDISNYNLGNIKAISPDKNLSFVLSRFVDGEGYVASSKEVLSVGASSVAKLTSSNSLPITITDTSDFCIWWYGNFDISNIINETTTRPNTLLSQIPKGYANWIVFNKWANTDRISISLKGTGGTSGAQSNVGKVRYGTDDLWCAQKVGSVLSIYRNGFLDIQENLSVNWTFGTQAIDNKVDINSYGESIPASDNFVGKFYYLFVTRAVDPILMQQAADFGRSINNRQIFDFNLIAYQNSIFDSTNHLVSVLPMVQSKYDTSDSLTKIDVLTSLAYRATVTNMGAGNGYKYNSGKGYVKHNTSNSRISLGDITQLNSASQFTIIMCLSLDAIYNNYLFGKNSEANFCSYFYGDGNLYFHLGGSFYCYTTMTGLWIAGSTVKIKWVYDGSLTGNANRIKIYVNDIQLVLTMANTIPATTPNLAGSPFVVGDVGGQCSFKGKLFSFSIFNKALTDAESKVVESLIPNFYGYNALYNGDGSFNIEVEPILTDSFNQTKYCYRYGY